MAIGILRRKISPAIWPYVAALEASYLCHDIPDVFLTLIEPCPDELDARLGESTESHSRSESHSEDFDEDFEEPLDDIEESLDEAEARSFQNERFVATRKLLEMLYDRPSDLVNNMLFSVTIFDLHVMERRYDKFSELASDFAEVAWSRLNENDGSLPEEITLSSAEHDRFCRAVYRLEIFHILEGVLKNHGDAVYDLFFLRHSPWENEQMACIYHFLEVMFARSMPLSYLPL